MTYGLAPIRSADGLSPDMGDEYYFVMAGIATFATMLDARAILRGGLTGPARTTRHLWRMCLGLFMATGSFFVGQARLFSPEIGQSGVLALLATLPLALLLFWLLRVRVWPLVRRLWAPA